MHVITKRRLTQFVEVHPDAEVAVLFWYQVVKENNFYNVQDVKNTFNSADYIGNGRLVFNINRNKYRLIAKFKFKPKDQRVYIRFIGTHAEYDAIKGRFINNCLF
jgi:mRNA interferase HigB